MEASDLEKINTEIRQTIKQTVNGKIDAQKLMLENYIAQDNKWKEDYERRDRLWKENVLPAIQVMQKIQDFTSVGGWILRGIVIIGAAIGALYAFYKFIVQR